MMRIVYLVTAILFLSAFSVEACPTCVSTGNQKYFVQTFIALTAMFFIPLIAVGVVIWRIRKMGGFKDDNA